MLSKESQLEALHESLDAKLHELEMDMRLQGFEDIPGSFLELVLEIYDFVESIRKLSSIKLDRDD